MVEIDGFMTVELSVRKCGTEQLVESYSSKDQDLIEAMVENFSRKVKPTFNSKGDCANEKYSIHIYTY